MTLRPHALQHGTPPAGKAARSNAEPFSTPSVPLAGLRAHKLSTVPILVGMPKYQKNMGPRMHFHAPLRNAAETVWAGSERQHRIRMEGGSRGMTLKASAYAEDVQPGRSLCTTA